MPVDDVDASKPNELLYFGRLLRYACQGVALVSIVTVLVLLFTLGPATVEKLGGFSRAGFSVLVGMVVLAWLCNGARTWLLSRALGHSLTYPQSLCIKLSMEFGVAASPGGVGGSAILLALLRRAGVPLSAGTSMLGADILVDVLFFVLVTPLAIHVLLRDPDWLGVLPRVELAPLTAAALVPAVILLLALALLGHRRWSGSNRRKTGSRRGGRIRLAGRLRPLRRDLRDAARASLASARFLLRERRRTMIALFAVGCLQSLCRYGVLPLLLLLLGCEKNPLPLLLMQGVLFSLSLVLIAPGGGGGVEVMALLLLPLFVPTALIGVVLLLWRLLTYHLYVVVGGAVFFWTLHRLDRWFPDRESSL